MIYLPAVAFAAILFFFTLTKQLGSREESARCTALALGLVSLWLPEILSNFHALGPTGLRAAGLLLLLSVVFFAWRFGLARMPSLPPMPTRLYAGPLVLVVLGAFAAGALSAPNNWDSMTYHLARVAQWLSRGATEIYPTSIQFQVTHPSWAERALLAIYIDTNSDHWLFLLQFLLWIGCGAQVFALAHRLGVRAPFAAAALALTLPMAVLQASSTQNDLANSFWALLFASTLLAFRAERAGRDRIALGLSLGLFLSVKGTAYLFAPAIFLAFWITAATRARLRDLAGPLVIAAFVNLPTLLPEVLVFGTPLPAGGENYFLGHLTPATWFATLIKNICLHLNGPGASWNGLVLGFLRASHSLLGVSPEDPALVSLRGGFSLPPLFLYEDYDGNTFFFLLAVAVPFLLWSREKLRSLAPYYLAFALGFAVFSGLRWNPWHARLQLPLFFLLAPAVAAGLERRGGIRVLHGTALLACLLALPYAWLNRVRPLVPWAGAPAIYQLDRPHQYFASRPQLAAPYFEIERAIRAKDCHRVGIMADWDSYEYPLWALLGFPADANLRIVHVDVQNETKDFYRKEELADLCYLADLRAIDHPI